MSISGSLETFSIAELFQIIDLGSKSGRLIVQTLSEQGIPDPQGTYYIWFEKGSLVAVTSSQNNPNLVNIIDCRKWISRLITKRLDTICPKDMPVGTYLHKMRLLNSEQLNALFQIQLDRVYQLFEVPSGWFKFDEIAELQKTTNPCSLPRLEMTGHRIKATEATLQALRILENWEHLAQRLPDPNSALQQLQSHPNLPLKKLESQIWELANEKISLKVMTQELSESLANVQKVAFSLMVTGLVEEMPIINHPNNLSFSSTNKHNGSMLALSDRKLHAEQSTISKSLLENVLNFLRNIF